MSINCHSTIPFASDIIEFSEVKNINISSHKYGETVMMDLTLNTCLSVVSVSVYKGREKVFGTRISNNHQPSVKVSFPILVESESIGEYGVRAYAPEASTSLIHFNVTGKIISFKLICYIIIIIIIINLYFCRFTSKYLVHLTFLHHHYTYKHTLSYFNKNEKCISLLKFNIIITL